MNAVLMEELLNEKEGTTLDFKRDQYKFEKLSDDENSELSAHLYKVSGDRLRRFLLHKKHSSMLTMGIIVWASSVRVMSGIDLTFFVFLVLQFLLGGSFAQPKSRTPV